MGSPFGANALVSYPSSDTRLARMKCDGGQQRKSSVVQRCDHCSLQGCKACMPQVRKITYHEHDSARLHWAASPTSLSLGGGSVTRGRGRRVRKSVRVLVERGRGKPIQIKAPEKLESEEENGDGSKFGAKAGSNSAGANLDDEVQTASKANAREHVELEGGGTAPSVNPSFSGKKTPVWRVFNSHNGRIFRSHTPGPDSYPAPVPSAPNPFEVARLGQAHGDVNLRRIASVPSNTRAFGNAVDLDAVQKSAASLESWNAPRGAAWHGTPSLCYW